MAASFPSPSWPGWELDCRTSLVKGIRGTAPSDPDESGPQEADTLFSHLSWPWLRLDLTLFRVRDFSVGMSAEEAPPQGSREAPALDGGSN